MGRERNTEIRENVRRISAIIDTVFPYHIFFLLNIIARLRKSRAREYLTKRYSNREKREEIEDGK